MNDNDISSSGLLTSVAVRGASGRAITVYTRPAHELVDMSELSTSRATVGAIVSECLYAGASCSLSQALAAAYSVPDGAPIGLAILNVGPEPSDDVVARHARFQAVERSTSRALRRA